MRRRTGERRKLSVAVFVGGVALLTADSGRAAQAVAAEEKPVRVLELALRDRIEEDGVLVRTQRQETELLTAAGAQAYSQMGVAFLEANQEARFIEISVTKSDGRKLDLLASAPTDVAPLLPPDLPIYSDLRMLRAAIPRLDVGDRVIAISEVYVRPLAEKLVWTEMLFENPLSPERMSYELDLPESSALRVWVRPDFEARLEERRTDGRWIRRWHVEPASPEAAKASAKPIGETKSTPEIQVSSFSSWDELAAWWYTLAPPRVDDAVRAKAGELIRDIAEPAARLNAIHRFAAQEIQYLALPLGIGRYKAREPEEILRSGVGDCKDKIRLLLSMAKAVGIDVEPVLIHTAGERDFVPEPPSPSQFDHVVARAKIGGGEQWFDPTSEMTRPGELPAAVRGLSGLAVVAGDRSRKVPAKGAMVRTPGSSALTTAVRSETTGSIGADGTVRAKFRLTFTGDEEVYRLVVKYGDENVRRKFVEQYATGWGKSAEVREVRYLDPTRLDEPFWVEADFEWIAGSSLWRGPEGLQLPAGFVWIEAPLSSAERGPDGTTPEPLKLEQPRRQFARARFELPEGVRSQPPIAVELQRGFARFHSTYKVEGRVLELERELVRTVDEVSASGFAELRNFVRLLERDREQTFDLEVPAELAAGAETANELVDRCDDAVDEKRYAEAVVLCGKAAELEPGHPRVWNVFGMAHDWLGNDDEAKAAYERQIEVDPHHGYAYANLGLLAWNAGDRAEGERWFRRQIEVAPFEPFAYGRLGRLLADLGRLDEAESNLRKAIKLGSDDARDTAALLEVVARLGRYAELVELALAKREALTNELGLPVLLHLLTLDLEGRALELHAILEEERSRSVDILRNGMELPPGEESIAAVYSVVAGWEIRGRRALQEGRFEEAFGLFDAALRFSLSPTAAEGAARAQAAQGRKSESERLLALAVTLAVEGGEAFERAFAQSVPASESRRALLAAVREESWQLRSQSRQVPGSASQQGELWVVVAPDGAVKQAAPAEPGKLAAVVKSLESRTIRFTAAPGNDVPLVSKLLVHCSVSDECTLMFEPPGKVWRELRAQPD